MNAISYSLFGYEPKSQDFKSYLRGLEINIRVARELYGSEWIPVVHIDKRVYESPYRDILISHSVSDRIHLNVFDTAPLCEMMLWRMRPIFEHGQYDRVLCRDTDSLLCLKERQAVEYWIQRGRPVHCITDSISHTISLMGGMIGFMSKEFRKLIDTYTWENMMQMNNGVYDFNRKGSDQDFLQRFILPKVHMHMTEHYLKGMPYSFREDCIMHEVQDLPIEGDMNRLRELDGYGFHIGAAGFQIDNVVKWLGSDSYFDAIEKRFPDVFYWHL